MIAGVCGGLGRRLGVDPVILRVVVVVLAFFAGAGIVLYAAAWLFMPVDDTNRSILSDALGSNPQDRVRSVLTAGALLVVVGTAAVVALDGGFVPGLLIAIVVLAVLLVVRRDDGPVPTGQPGYPHQGFPPPPARPAGAPSYGGATYGADPYAQTTYGSTAYEATTPFVPTGSSPYPTAPTGSGAEPAASGDPSDEATVVTGRGPDADPTVVIPSRPIGSGAAEPTVSLPVPTGGFVPPVPPPSSTGSSWQPQDIPPSSPPPAYLADPGPPPAPRERSYLGILTVSAMLAVLGVMSIVDLSGVAVPLAGYFVAALAVVAGGLVLGAWMGRSRGLIALGILISLALGPAVLVDAAAGDEFGDWNQADNVRLAPADPDALAPLYDYGAGSFRLDLGDLDFVGEDLATSIDMSAGEVIVIVPPDVDVAVHGSVVLGDLVLFDRQSSGFDASASFSDLGADGVGGGQLDLSIDVGLGRVEVRRATS